MTDNIQICLVPSSDDPTLESDAMQSSFGGFYKSLVAHGIKADPIHYAFDSANGGGGLVGEYLIQLAQTIGPTLGVILVAWLNDRSGRKIRVKVGETEVEAQTIDDIEKLLHKIKVLQTESSLEMRPKYEIKNQTKNRSTLWVVFAAILLTLGVIGEGLGMFDVAITKQTTISRQEAKTFADIPPSPELLACIDQKMGELKSSGGYFEPKPVLTVGTDGAARDIYYSAGDVFTKLWLWKACGQKAKAWIVNECEPQSHASFVVCELQLNVFATDEFDRFGMEMVYVPISPSGAVGALKSVGKGFDGGIPLWRAMKMTNASPFIFEPGN